LVLDDIRDTMPPLDVLFAFSSFFFFQCAADHRVLHSFPTRRSSDLISVRGQVGDLAQVLKRHVAVVELAGPQRVELDYGYVPFRSEEHTSELQSRENIVCRLLLEKKKPSTTLPTRAEIPRMSPAKPT